MFITMESYYRKSCIGIAVQFLIVLLMLSLVSGTIVTASASGVITTTQPSALPLTNCDGVGTCECFVLVLNSNCGLTYLSVFCPTGTCFTGYDGYVGCCTV